MGASTGGSAASGCSRTQAVKGVDQKSTGLCPRRFESCRLRQLLFAVAGRSKSESPAVGIEPTTSGSGRSEERR